MKKKTKKFYNKKILSGIIIASALTGVALNQPLEVEAAADPVYVVNNTYSQIALQSSKLKVWLNQGGNYGMTLLPGGSSVFYSTQSAYANVWRYDDYDYNGFPTKFQNLTFVSMNVNNNVIEQIRTDGQFNYYLRLSIVNATTLGAYLKVEMEARNITNTPQNVGISFNMDTMINGSDSSPFEVIENGWIGFYNGVQATAYYQDVFHTTQADAIYLGRYNTQYPNPISAYSVGQIIYPGDSGAGFYYRLKSVPAGGSRKESWIIGMGPQNKNPSFTLTSPTEGHVLYTGQTLPMAGIVKDENVNDVLEVKWSMDGGAEQRLQTLTATGGNQAISSYYTVPSNLAQGYHTLQFWVMDDKGGVSSSNTRRIYINPFKTPTVPTFSNVTTNSLNFSFNKLDNLPVTTYEVNRVQGNKNFSLNTNTADTDTGLTANTLYEYRVRAKNVLNDYTAYSAVGRVYTLANKPNAGTIDGTTAGTYRLSWGANGNPTTTKYHYEIRNATTNAVVKSGDVATNSATVTGVPTNTVYRIYVKAVNGDNVGTEELFMGETYQDVSSPNVTITRSTTNWIKGNVTVNISATDNLSGVRYIELPDGSKVDGSTASFTATTNGTYVVNVKDNYGNTKTENIVISNIDKDASILTLKQTPDVWTNTDVVINATSTDAGSGVKRIQLPNGNWVSASTASYTVAENGSYTFQIEDNVGNMDSKTIKITNIDKIVPNPPTLTVNVPENVWVDQDVLGTITDNGDGGDSGFKIQYKLEGAINQDWRNYRGEPVLMNVDGTTKISARVKDYAGNISPVVSKTVKIDQDAPTITVTPDITSLTKEDVRLTVKANDVGGRGVKRVQLPDGNWVYSDTAVYTVQDNGYFTFKAEDNAGHVSTYTFKVSNIKKNVLITPIRQVDLELHSEDLIGVESMRFRNEEGTWSNWMPYSVFAEWVLSEQDGLKHVWVEYKDKFGNISEKIEDIVILDQTKPLISQFTINDDAPYTNKREVTLKVKATDNLTDVKTLFISNDNKTWTEIPYTEEAIPWTLTSGDAIKTVYIKAKDGAGNISTVITDTIILDMTKPTGSILINNGDAFTAVRDVNLTLTYADNLSGVAKVQVIEDGHKYTLPSPIANSPTTIPWTLDFGVVKTVSILVTDKAGNVSVLGSDSITVDKLTIKQFRLDNVVNPLEFNKKNPFKPLVWAFEAQPMIAGGNITFSVDIKSAYEPAVVKDKMEYKVDIVGANSYHKVFMGEMGKSVDHYTTTITIPKDVPDGAKVYYTGTGTRVLTVSPFDTQVVYFPGDTDATQKAFIGEIENNIYNVIRFNETK